MALRSERPKVAISPESSSTSTDVLGRPRPEPLMSVTLVTTPLIFLPLIATLLPSKYFVVANLFLSLLAFPFFGRRSLARNFINLPGGCMNHSLQFPRGHITAQSKIQHECIRI